MLSVLEIRWSMLRGMNAWSIIYPSSAWSLKFCFLIETSEKKLITDALNKNQFLKRLEPQQIRDMVECMYERTFQQGSYVTRQGEPGNHIFVLKGEYCLPVQCVSAKTKKIISKSLRETGMLISAFLNHSCWPHWGQCKFYLWISESNKKYPRNVNLDLMLFPGKINWSASSSSET